MTADERLTEERFGWMRSLREASYPDGEVGADWVAEELSRDACAAGGEAHARRRMMAFYVCWADADVPELAHVTRTVGGWSEEIFAYHRTGPRASNGRIEGTNNKLGVPKSIAYGFVNSDTFAARALLTPGPATSL